jgi:hypothetical protein
MPYAPEQRVVPRQNVQPLQPLLSTPAGLRDGNPASSGRKGNGSDLVDEYWVQALRLQTQIYTNLKHARLQYSVILINM